MISFDIVSDTHLDFYAYAHERQDKQKRAVINYVENILPVNSESNVILIAGDISHYNDQFIWFFNELRNHYEHILFTTGNHDRYLVSKTQMKKYERDSQNRIDEIKQIANNISGVHYLDGNVVEIEGINFGGAPMWHDASYTKNLGITNEQEINELYFKFMNDGTYIPELTSYDLYFYREYEKLLKIIDSVDVMVSHYGPIVPENLPLNHLTATTGFYYFSGESLLDLEGEHLSAPKTWLYGHTHDHYDFMYENTNIITNPIGYPRENMNTRKIKSYML